MTIKTKYNLGDIFVQDRDTFMITQIIISIGKPTSYRLVSNWYSEEEINELFTLVKQEEILEKFNQGK